MEAVSDSGVGKTSHEMEGKEEEEEERGGKEEFVVK